MMKQLIYLFLTALLAPSCKKTCPGPEPASMVGFWVGKKNARSDPDGTYPTIRFALLFRKDGTVRAMNYPDTSTGYKGEGTYLVSGSTVTATYLFSGAPFDALESITANVNTGLTFAEGARSVGGSPAIDRGLIFLVKQ